MLSIFILHRIPVKLQSVFKTLTVQLIRYLCSFPLHQRTRTNCSVSASSTSLLVPLTTTITLRLDRVSDCLDHPPLRITSCLLTVLPSLLMFTPVPTPVSRAHTGGGLWGAATLINSAVDPQRERVFAESSAPNGPLEPQLRQPTECRGMRCDAIPSGRIVVRPSAGAAVLGLSSTSDRS